MPYHKTVTAARYFKIQIPAEIFLTGFFFSLYALFPEFIDNPLRHIISETTRIDEILFWLGHVESRALERDDSSNFRGHGAEDDSNSSEEPSATWSRNLKQWEEGNMQEGSVVRA
jgi:hypothetical protein